MRDNFWTWKFSATKTSVFRDKIPCSLMKFKRPVRKACHLHLQGWRVRKARKQNEAGSKHESAHAGFLISLLFDSEKGGDIFLRNVGWISLNYKALYPRRRNCSEQLLWEPLIQYNLVAMVSCQCSQNNYFTLDVSYMELVYTHKPKYRGEEHDTTHIYSSGISFPKPPCVERCEFQVIELMRIHQKRKSGIKSTLTVLQQA
jgi:hypothetical protein